MKKEVFFVLAIFIVSYGLFGQEATKWCHDGKDWEDFGAVGQMMKIGYVMGLNDARGAMSSLAAAFLFVLDEGKFVDNNMKFFDFTEKNAYNVDVTGAAYGQIVIGIDELYKDYANKHIPIFAVATLVVKRITGKIREEDVGGYLRQLRAVNYR